MAIQKELWVNKVQELLFPDNAFYRNAINDTAFIEGHAVHVPQAGALNAAVRDRATIPAVIGSRADVDLTYFIHEFSSDPVVITSIEDTEDSYDKLNSVTGQMAKQLYTSIGEWTAYEWATDVNVVKTSGTSRAVYTTYQTGTRNTLVFDDVIKAMGMLNTQNVPMEGRKILIDGYLYQDVLKMTEFKSSNELMGGILSKGAIGTLAGAEVFMRTPALRYDSAFAKVSPDTATTATDNLGLLIWHPDFVRFALGTSKVFADTDSPSYYGTIISSLARSGAVKSIKTTDVGVVSIVEQA